MSIGITEGYDPSYDLRWTNSTCDMNIIITKRLTDDMINGLLKLKSNTILHLTTTGLTVLEPHGYAPEKQFSQLNKLIDNGFPASQVVLRIDPIIPAYDGINTALSVLSLFTQNSKWYQPPVAPEFQFGEYNENIINRVRFSFMDLYPHVKNRFQEVGIPLPYSTFNPPKTYVANAIKALTNFTSENALSLTFETCAEQYEIIPKEFHIGCVSRRDTEILGLNDSVFTGTNNQRAACLCCSRKTELIPIKKQCPNGCLYCYWKDMV